MALVRYSNLTQSQALLRIKDATAKFLGHQWLMRHSNQRLLCAKRFDTAIRSSG
jgi:hypothetical protein